MKLYNIAVFISGSGSNLQSLIDYSKKEENKKSINRYKINLVISSKKDAYGLDRALNEGIEALYLEDNNKIIKILEEKDIDFIVLAGYLKKLDKKIIEIYKNKIINIHPSLIPSFSGKGYYGEKVHKAVYESGVKITGATVHIVDENFDTGNIILQKEVKIGNFDTADIIAKNVLEVEHKIIVEALLLMINNRVIIKNKRTIIKE